jgi:hypothetical protein
MRRVPVDMAATIKLSRLQAAAIRTALESSIEVVDDPSPDPTLTARVLVQILPDGECRVEIVHSGVDRVCTCRNQRCIVCGGKQ